MLTTSYDGSNIDRLRRSESHAEKEEFRARAVGLLSLPQQTCFLIPLKQAASLTPHYGNRRRAVGDDRGELKK